MNSIVKDKTYVVFSLILYTAVTFKTCRSIDVTLAVQEIKMPLRIRGELGSRL